MKLEFEMHNNNVKEEVAEIIHNMWMLWAQEILTTEINLTEERRRRWENECILPYAKLSENMKDLDRRFAMEILGKIRWNNL